MVILRKSPQLNLRRSEGGRRRGSVYGMGMYWSEEECDIRILR